MGGAILGTVLSHSYEPAYAPAPRVYYAPPPEQVWVPGHYETRYERQWVPGHWEVERYAGHGEDEDDGYSRGRRVWIPGRYEDSPRAGLAAGPLGGTRVTGKQSFGRRVRRPETQPTTPRGIPPRGFFFPRITVAWGGIIPVMGNGEHDKSGSPLRNSLWNLLFRVLSSTDFARIAWTTVLRGACLSFFKEPIDELPLSDNDASRLALKDRFFDLPDHRVYDLFEFFLVDDHAGLKEMDRKLIRRGLNDLLEREGTTVRLYHDRFRPYQDVLGFDEVAQAGETVRLFDMAAAQRHMETAVAYLSRRPEPESRGAIREAVLAVTAVAREVAAREVRKGEEEAPLVVGSVAHAAAAAGIPAELLGGIDLLLRRAHALSGLPVDGVESPAGEGPVDPREAHFLVVFASSLIVYLKG